MTIKESSKKGARKNNCPVCGCGCECSTENCECSKCVCGNNKKEKDVEFTPDFSLTIH